MKLWQPKTLEEAQVLYQMSIVGGAAEMAQRHLDAAVEQVLGAEPGSLALTVAQVRANDARAVRDALILAPQVMMEMRAVHEAQAKAQEAAP